MADDGTIQNNENAEVGKYRVIRGGEKEKVHGETVAKIASSTYYVHKDTDMEDLAADMGQIRDLSSIGVVDDNGNVVGVIVRDEFFSQLDQPLPGSANANKPKPVEKAMRSLVTYDRDTCIFTISGKLQREARNLRVNYYAITECDDKYYGVFSTVDMLLYLSTISQKDINMARAFQNSMVKKDSSIQAGRLEIAGSSSISKGVGGDFYDVQTPSTGKKLLTVANVSGKGMAASIITSSFCSMYKLYDFTAGVPAFLVKLNEYINNAFDSQKFVTGVFAEIDEETGKTSIYDMGHSYMYVFRNGTLSKIKTGSSTLPIGVMDAISPKVNSFQLEPGDIFLIMTDGIVEQTSRSGEEYGEARVAQVLGENSSLDISAIKEALFKSVEVFRGTQPQHDDMTVIFTTFK